MVIAIALLNVAAALAPVRAASSLVVLTSEHSLDYQIKRWIASQRPVRRKLAEAIRRERQLSGGEDAEDLRDAVSARPPALSRRELIERLPGMQASPFASCRDLEGCPEAPSSFWIKDKGQITDAIVALIRPWTLLQSARGVGLAFEAPDDRSERLMSVRLDGLPRARLSIAVLPLPSGGYSVSLSGRPDDPAALYARERARAIMR